MQTDIQPCEEKRIGAELEEIRKRSGGVLQCEDVVEFAKRNRNSALHGRFTWDDTEAARKWRLDEAAKLIARVKIHPPELKEPTRYYVSVSSDRVQGKGYRPIGEVLRNDSLRDALLTDALNDLDRVRDKYRYLKQLAEVWSAVDRVNK